MDTSKAASFNYKVSWLRWRRNFHLIKVLKINLPSFYSHKKRSQKTLEIWKWQSFLFNNFARSRTETKLMTRKSFRSCLKSKTRETIFFLKKILNTFFKLDRRKMLNTCWQQSTMNLYHFHLWIYWRLQMTTKPHEKIEECL